MEAQLLTWVMAITVVFLSVAASILLVLLLRKSRVSWKAFCGTEDVETYTVTIIGGIYGVLLAFMIFAVWSKFDETNTTVEREADALTNLYRLAESLPQPLRGELRRDCREYVTVMTQDEWPAMAHRQSSIRAWHLVDHMWGIVSNLPPKALPDEVLHDHVLTTYTHVTEYRRYRLFRAKLQLPGLLWAILIFGGVLTVGLSALFRTESLPQQLVKTGALAAMISFSLLTIWDLDGPFDGAVRVTPSAFQEAVSVMEAN